MAESPGTESDRRKAADRGELNKHNGAGPDQDRLAKDSADDGGQDAGAKPDAEPGKARTWVKPVLLTLLAIGVIVGAIWGLNFWRFSSMHVSTDDAYVVGNLVNVSPTVSGTLQVLLVDEGTFVHRGQLIAKLSDAGPQATLRQAQANYRAALSQIPQAERNLQYQQEATNAAIHKAQAGLSSQLAKTGGAEQQVVLASGASRNQVHQAASQVTAARASHEQFSAQASAADAAVAVANQGVQTAMAAAEAVQHQVATAQSAVQAAQSRVQGARAEADRTTKDEARYRVLYVQDAVSAQAYDNARALARSADANLRAVQFQADEALSQLDQAKAGARQAVSQVEQSRNSVDQLKAQARAAHRAADAAGEQVNVARAGLGLAQANSTQVGIQEANLLSTMRQTGESQADVESAQAGNQQVEVRRKQLDIYRAQAQQALAALNNAQILLGDTKIYAPADGTIVKKVVNAGASLSQGEAIVTMTQGDYVWVEANFKETQLKNVRPGELAEVEADAVPGRIFKARVHSINQATGAATSLLPPDNATGNFTKVVQRVPVRIELVPADENDDKKYARAKDISALRQGMSVTAVVNTAGARQETRKPVGVGPSGAFRLANRSGAAR